MAVIAAIGAVGGGSYALDFSNTQTTNTNTDNSQSTIINEGDTIINEIISDAIELDDEFKDDLIDFVYDEYCEEIDPDSPECDEYWGE